jgi:hypothetical protein
MRGGAGRGGAVAGGVRAAAGVLSRTSRAVQQQQQPTGRSLDNWLACDMPLLCRVLRCGCWGMLLGC